MFESVLHYNNNIIILITYFTGLEISTSPLAPADKSLTKKQISLLGAILKVTCPDGVNVLSVYNKY